MAEFSKQEVVDDQYYISTTVSNQEAGKHFATAVFAYNNKRIIWSKMYKKVYYETQKEAEEGHKQLKKEFS